jgi:hypothetical protein
LTRNAIYRFRKQTRENYYTTLEETGSRANEMPAEETLQWARRNFTDFTRFARWDGVLPVLVSQATTAVPENLDKTDYRTEIGNDIVGMTLPVLAESFQEMDRLIASVAQQEGAIYVNGFSMVPHDFDHMVDHVHLTDKGMDLLGRIITDGLLASSEFRKLAEQVARKTH